MYPQPPILIRRSLADDVLPAPLNGDPAGYPIGKGADIFISVWNLHRYAAAPSTSSATLLKLKTSEHEQSVGGCTLGYAAASSDPSTVFTCSGHHTCGKILMCSGQSASQRHIATLGSTGHGRDIAQRHRAAASTQMRCTFSSATSAWTNGCVLCHVSAPGDGQR